MSHGLHKMLQLSQLRKWMQYDCLSQQQLGIHRTCTETAKRAFSVAAPNVWNSLPIDIRNTISVDFSQRTQETHFHSSVYTHDETYPPQRLCILSLDRLHGAKYGFMLCYVMLCRRWWRTVLRTPSGPLSRNCSVCQCWRYEKIRYVTVKKMSNIRLMP